MILSGSSTDYQSAFSALSTPIFSDNVKDFLGTGTFHTNPSAIITVNSIADVVNGNDGVTTLREAINQANADNGNDLIVFDRSLFSTAQTITLSLGELDITHNVDIIAPRDTLTGGDLVTVSGNKTSRVFEIEKGATVSLNGLIVADGKATDDNGGGIKNSGTLTLDSSIVRNNSALIQVIVGGYGGGIFNDGNLTLSNSTISGNESSTKFRYISGGGIYNSAGTVSVNNSTISGNRSNNGGGIYNSDGTVSVNNSTISGNVSGLGGGISNSTGTFEVNNSTISGNMSFSGGGIDNGGTFKVNNSTISGNYSGSGGDIYRFGGGINNGGTFEVNNSTISGNTSNSSGGGIYNSGTFKVNNSTISGNKASDNGGGIYNDYTGISTIVFSTVTQNIAAKGGGVYQDDVPPNSTFRRGSNSVRNTIIASNLNTDGGVNPDVSGTFTSLGYNLIGNTTGSTGFDATGDIVGTSDNPINPRLASLDFYGGSTKTIALLPDSRAINAGDPTVLDTDPTTDQRGFPRVINGRVDIGAFEFS